tara:strand:+ start:785 stop:1876 length:1092 start_codon:yes stop_codon:yes gene_type:complete
MRHLRVPSAQTAHWIQHCKSRGWYEIGHRVQQIGDETAIPLSDLAPVESDKIWEGNLFVEIEPTEKKPRFYWEHIASETRDAFNDEFPHGFEIQGDVLLVKIPSEMVGVESEIATAMMAQFPSVRVVCHDEGVEGEFRIRNLRVLKARGDDSSTQTQYREHGYEFTIDPAAAYFSGRLSSQRMKTLETILSFRERKKRALVIVDPYAGVGPSMALLYTDSTLISKAYLNDLNPEAIPLLKSNMERFDAKRKHAGMWIIECMDARNLAQAKPEMLGSSDVLLVNLPHDGISHLSELFSLLNDEISLVCGWSIQDKGADILSQLQSATDSIERTMIECQIEEIKGFSSAKAMFRYDFVLSSRNMR